MASDPGSKSNAGNLGYSGKSCKIELFSKIVTIASRWGASADSWHGQYKDRDRAREGEPRGKCIDVMNPGNRL